MIKSITFALAIQSVVIRLARAPEVVPTNWQRGNLSITPCDSGSFAPHRHYDILKRDKIQCDLSCDNGCSMGFAVFLNEMTEFQHLLCYLLKFRANFYISQNGDRCSCGLYVRNKDRKNKTRIIETFENCDNVAVGFSKVIRLNNRAIIQDSCQAHCDSIDAYVSKEGNREYTLVYCAVRPVANDLDWITKDLTGECEMKQGHIRCVCGVLRPRQYAPFKCEETQYFFYNEKSKIRGFSRQKDLNWNKDLMRDFRRHNIPSRIIDPSFRYLRMEHTRPVLESNHHKNKQKYLPPQPLFEHGRMIKGSAKSNQGKRSSSNQKKGSNNKRSSSPKKNSSPKPKPEAEKKRSNPGFWSLPFRKGNK